LDYLRGLAGAFAETAYGIGTVRVGSTVDPRRAEPLHLLAAHYLQGFQHGTQMYPFSSGDAA